MSVVTARVRRRWAAALVRAPRLLVLDEPTHHDDVPAGPAQRRGQHLNDRTSPP